MKKLIAILILTVLLTGFVFNPSETVAKSKVYDLKIYAYPTRAAINWHTVSQYKTELHYGETLDDLGHIITTDRISDWHSYEIKGLVPGTKYYYRIVLKDKNNKIIDKITGEFVTRGRKPQSRLFKPFVYLSFDGNFYSQNNQYPAEILNPQGLKIVEPSIWQGALQVRDKNSHITYSCDPKFNPGYGTVMAWVRLTGFDKDMVIWQTDDSRYALYFDHGHNFNRIVARAGWNEKDDQGEVSYFFKTSGSGKKVWLPGEWHLVGMTWEGKINGTLKLYIDGQQRGSAFYTNGGGCTTFMVGNNYRHDMNWSNGQIDDFKLFDWTMGSAQVRNDEYERYIVNQQKDLIPRPGQVAGYMVRYFKDGKLLKAPDNKVYVISQGKRIHISNLNALQRFGNNPIIPVSWEEINQYPDGGKFYAWSRYPAGSLLKVYNSPAVYWLDAAGVLHYIPNEQVFYKYKNEWVDVIEVSQDELSSYIIGTPSQ